MTAICDRAVVRDGLLQVLGAGINVLTRESVPAAADVDLAVLLLPESDEEVLKPHRMTVSVRMASNDREIAHMEAQLDPPASREVPRPRPQIPISFPLRLVKFERFGEYRVILWLGDEEVVRLDVLVRDSSAGGNGQS